jgi:transposase
MAIRLKNLDRDTPMLLPPDLRDWIPDDHIVHFLIDAVDALPCEYFRFNTRGTGDEQYPLRMMLALLIYCYVTGRFSSRAIEEATWSDVIVRYICGGNLHPNHDTICTFRRKNRELFEKAFVEVLLMAKESCGLKKAGTVSIDGTKIKASASKHSAVSCKRAGEQIELLRREVEQLTAKAEGADKTPLDDGLSVPEEIERRKDRIKNLEKARKVIEARYEEERQQKQAEYEMKKAAYDEKEKNRKLRGFPIVVRDNSTGLCFPFCCASVVRAETWLSTAREMNARTCKACGHHQHDADARFCKHCGADLSV